MEQPVLFQVEKLFKELLDRPVCENLLSVPARQGVYIIYNKTQNPIYVGKGKDLKRRICSDHISGENKCTTSTFRNKVHNQYNIPFGPKMRTWINDNCKFAYLEVPDFDVCHLLEALTIAVLRKNYKLLNVAA